MAINTAIADSLRGLAVGGITLTVQNYNELTEGMQDAPAVQVYWEEVEGALPGNTSRTTLSGAIRHSKYLFHIDLYARQRSQLAEDMTAVLEWVDAIETSLQGQNRNFFGVDGVREFHYVARRKLFSAGGVLYAGAQVDVTVHVF